MKWSVLDQSPSSAGSTQDAAIRDSIALALAQRCDVLGYELFAEAFRLVSVAGKTK